MVFLFGIEYFIFLGKSTGNRQAKISKKPIDFIRSSSISQSNCFSVIIEPIKSNKRRKSLIQSNRLSVIDRSFTQSNCLSIIFEPIKFHHNRWRISKSMGLWHSKSKRSPIKRKQENNVDTNPKITKKK